MTTLVGQVAVVTDAGSGIASYQWAIGTTPGGGDVLGPMASSTGLRRLPQLGNAHHQWTSSALPVGQVLYWSVQAIDTLFAGSPFAPEASVKVLQPPKL